MRNFIVIILLFFLSTMSLICINNDFKLEEIIEYISDETGSYPEFDEIEDLHLNPMNLNEASVSAMKKIPGFSQYEIERIVALSISDSINSFKALFENITLSREQKLLLKYCAKFEKEKKSKDYLQYRVRNRNYLNKPISLSENKLIGSELDLYQRINGKINSFSFNLLADKDFGEKHIADFLSANVSYSSKDFKFIIGDYYIQSGMGNVLWKSFPLRKGASVISPANRFDNDIKSYKSSLGTHFFRGISALYNFNLSENTNIKTILWYSDRQLSGNFDSLTNSISSIYKQGYYRTINEECKKNVFNENSFGSSITLGKGNFEVGFNYLNLKYDKKIETQSSIDISGKSAEFLSTYLRYFINDFVILNEYTIDNNLNNGIKLSVVYPIESFDFISHLRYFSKDFKSPYGSIFGESSYPNDEVGLYLGARYKHSKDLIISSYLDLFADAYMFQKNDNQIIGFDIFSQIEYTLNELNNFLMRINLENKFVRDNITFPRSERRKLRLRLQYDITISKDFNIRFKNEFVNYLENDNTEFGYVMSIEAYYKIMEKLNITGRYAVFSTDSYNSAIWLYELNMPGYMQPNSVYGEGSRISLRLQYQFLDNLIIYINYINLYKNNTQSIGSSLLEIEGNNDSRLNLQIDWRMY